MDLASTFDQTPYFLIVSVSSLALFLFSFVLLFVGGDGDASIDAPGVNSDFSSEAHFKIFTVQSVLSFFMGHGWGAMTLFYGFDFSYFFSAMLSLVFGVALFVLTAYLLNKIQKLNHIKKLNYHSAIGQVGMVYMNIPELGLGKIEIEVGGQKKILNAMSNKGPISSYEKIIVTNINEKNEATVENFEDSINGEKK